MKFESCCKQKDKNKSNFFKVYHCNNEYYKISLNVDIDYDTFDIIYSVTNESSTSFNGIVEVCSSMLGSKKCKKMLQPQETITFEGNLTDSIIYNGEFKEDISVAYLRFPQSKEFCNFVMSNIVTIKPLIIPIPEPENWVYSVEYNSIFSNVEKLITVMNSMSSKSEAKDIVVEFIYLAGMQLSNITIDPATEHPEEITLEQDKFVFRIPSLLPGEIRAYRFNITGSSLPIDFPTMYTITSSTPFLFQQSKNVYYRIR